MVAGGPRIRADLEAHLTELRASAGVGGYQYLSVATSDKGSYKEEDILQFLDRHLPEMTPDRGWRILLLDACRMQRQFRTGTVGWEREGCRALLRPQYCNSSAVSAVLARPSGRAPHQLLSDNGAAFRDALRCTLYLIL